MAYSVYHRLSSKISLITPLAFMAALHVVPVHATPTVNFVPGTYNLADSSLGPAVDTLVVSVSGGIASFTLSGADNFTFSVPDGSVPSGITPGANNGSNPYYTSSSGLTASWDTSTYPDLTFWSTTDSGGLTAGAQPGDGGPNLFSVFQSTQGTGQVFTLSGVPEPLTLSLFGAGLAGAAAMRRRKAKQ